MGAAEELVKKLLGRTGRTGRTGQTNLVLPATPQAVKGEALQKVCAEPVPPATPSAGLAMLPAPGGVAVPGLDESVLPAARKFLRTPPSGHSAEERALRDEKVLFVRLVEEHKAACPGCSDREAAAAVAREHGRDFPRLAVAGKHGRSALHYNNLRNWRDGNRTRPGLRNPVTGAIDWTRADLLLKNYGGERRRYGDGEFWTEILTGCNNLSELQLSKSYRALVRKYAETRPDAEIPSLGQVRFQLAKLPKRLLELNRKGLSYYQQHYRDYNERDPESIRPNEAWVGDTQECDFMIRVKAGQDENGRDLYEAARPWICAILDIKSEYVVAWEMGVGSIDSRVIRNAFGRAVARYGRPYRFLTDNGKDYLKKGFTTPVVFTPDVANSKVYEHSILKELDIEHRVAEAYNARVKIVERFFSEMAKHYRHLRGYVGNRPENRPATADVWSKPGTNEYLMSIEEACDRMLDMIDTYHNTPAAGSKYLRGMTPAEAFAPEKRVMRPAMTYPDLYRSFLLPETQPRVLDPRGPGIHVDKQRYVVLRAHREAAWQYDRKPVMVKFDLASRDYCFLFDLSGAFIAAAHKPELLPYFWRTPEEREKLAAHQEAIRSEIRTLNTYTSELTRGFHKLDVASSYALPPEEFAEVAKLRKLDSKHSVGGESHNPAVYVTVDEHRARQAGKGEDLQKVCAKRKVLPATPQAGTAVEDEEFRKKLVTLLTDGEAPEENTVDPNQLYDQEDNHNDQPRFNPYDA